jgi:hypothetical protein
MISIIFEMPSPRISSTAAQTKAETRLAAWNCRYGIANMPATSGKEARSGRKNRPIMIANAPRSVTNRSPRGCPDCRDYFAAAGNAGSLPTSRASCWMITVAFRFAAIFLKRSIDAIDSARSVLKVGTPLVS